MGAEEAAAGAAGGRSVIAPATGAGRLCRAGYRGQGTAQHSSLGTTVSTRSAIAGREQWLRRGSGNARAQAATRSQVRRGESNGFDPAMLQWQLKIHVQQRETWFDRLLGTSEMLTNDVKPDV